MLFLSDVLAERSWGAKSGLCSDGPGECCAAGGGAQHAGPGGVCRASTEQHTTATCCPGPVPDTNAAPGSEHGTLAG